MTLGRKRVLFVIPALTGGPGRVFSTLLSHLDRGQFELHLAVLEARGALLNELPADVILHDLNVSRIRHAIPALVRLVWRIRPKTILATVGYLNQALVLFRYLLPFNTRLVVRETHYASFLKRYPTTKSSWIWNWIDWRVYRRADAVICLCDAMANDLEKNFSVPREKMVCIYNPVDAKRVCELAARERNPFRGPGPHLVTAAMLEQQKGLDLLIAAMPLVTRHLPSARLTILGEGSLDRELKAHVDSLGQRQSVHFAGFQANPWPYIANSDLFILPSRTEVLSNALVEALTLGKPSIATDCPGGNREIPISPDRLIFVPPENPAALAQAIIETCEEPASRQSNWAPQTISRFDLRQAVAKYSAVL